MKTYRVMYERDEDGWWIARIPSVPGVHSNGRSISEARRRVREALSLAVDDADTAVFKDDVRLPSEVKLALQRQSEARARAETARAEATLQQRAAARLLLVEASLSLRDAGELLGITQTMVKKLAPGKKTKTQEQRGRQLRSSPKAPGRAAGGRRRGSAG